MGRITRNENPSIPYKYIRQFIVIKAKDASSLHHQACNNISLDHFLLSSSNNNFFRKRGNMRHESYWNSTSY
ncbi:hypothetical protein D3C81_2004340 [compost metagenome]